VNKRFVIILNYHLVADVAKADNPYSLSTPAFLEHLELIKASAVPVISLNALAEQKPVPEFSVSLTFDDGYQSDYDTVMPLLETFNFTATFFPIADRMDTPGRLSWQQLKEISGRGFEIGSHGMSHRFLNDLALPGQLHELLHSKKTIEDKINKQVNYFALPYGRSNNAIRELAQKVGYKLLLTTGLRINQPGQTDVVLYRWNITQKTSPDLFKTVLFSNGNLPLRLKFSSALKHYAKKIVQPGFTNRINRILNHG
jgi:peptidoglycan/xylan/chitin deacetylase (PgdA/CDA1 family)